MNFNLNTNDLIRAAVVVVIGGVILLGVLTLLSPLLPIISVLIVLIILYFLYQWYKQGKIKF